MQIHVQYGRDGLDIDMPFRDVTVMQPQFVPGLADERAGFLDAVRRPIDSAPLADLIGADEMVAVVIADITRPLPSHRLLPWLFAELAHVPAENITVIVGTGTHRACTPTEIAAMVGAEVARTVRVINHSAYDDADLVQVGTLTDGTTPLLLNRHYAMADKRIVIGFIEPHFMAGFSGGYKGIFPAVAGLRSIMYYHRADAIGDPLSTWGVLEGNPTQAQIRTYGSAVPVDFCINVTLNHRREITRYYCGEVTAAHAQGCAFVKQTAMVACDRPYPLVLTSNSGFPLDQNLYQTVKGMCAAAEVIEAGGVIVTAARCNDGFPDHGNFTQLLLDHDSPAALLETIYAPGFHMLDQWQAQKLAQVQLKADIALYSELDPLAVANVRIQPIEEMNEFLHDAARRLGPNMPVAVLPEGPMTIPYLA